MADDYVVIRKNYEDLWNYLEIERKPPVIFLERKPVAVPVLVINERPHVTKNILFDNTIINSPTSIWYVPSSKKWRIVSGYIRFSCSSLVGLRTFELIIDDFSLYTISLNASQIRNLVMTRPPNTNLSVSTDYFFISDTLIFDSIYLRTDTALAGDYLITNIHIEQSDVV